MYLGAVLLSAMLTLSTSYPAHIENVARETLTDKCGTFCHHKWKVPKSVTDQCTDLCVQLLWFESWETFMFDGDQENTIASGEEGRGAPSYTRHYVKIGK